MLLNTQQEQVFLPGSAYSGGESGAAGESILLISEAHLGHIMTPVQDLQRPLKLKLVLQSQNRIRRHHEVHGVQVQGQDVFMTRSWENGALVQRDRIWYFIHFLSSKWVE